MTVPGYGFSHALKVWEAHPKADAYVCLSDSLAVGLKHLLQARNRRGNACDRVVGFDGSKLAQDEGVASFSQDLDWVGEQSLECLCRFLSRNRSSEVPVWPSDHEKEIVVPVRLKTWL